MKPLALATALERPRNTPLICFLPFAKSKTSTAPFELGVYVFDRRHNVVRFGERQLILDLAQDNHHFKLSTRLGEEQPCIRAEVAPDDGHDSAVYDLAKHEFVPAAEFKEQVLRIFHGCVRAINLAELQENLEQQGADSPSDLNAALGDVADIGSRQLTTEARLMYLSVCGSSDTEQVRFDAIRLAYQLTELPPTRFLHSVLRNQAPFVSPPDSYLICLWCLAKFIQTHYPLSPGSILTLCSEPSVWEAGEESDELETQYRGRGAKDVGQGLYLLNSGILAGNDAPVLIKRHTISQIAASPVIYTPPHRLEEVCSPDGSRHLAVPADQVAVATPVAVTPSDMTEKRVVEPATPPTMLTPSSDVRSDISMSTDQGSLDLSLNGEWLL